MNLWLRLIGLILASLRRPRIDAPFGPSRIAFRVWPYDLDVSMHMNNGRYWTLMDLGRLDLMLRSGLWRSILKNRWTPVVSAGQIRFRRELRLFQGVELETRIQAWTETHLVIEHRMLAGSPPAVAAVALVQAALYERRTRRYVPARELMAAIGVAETPSPPMTPEAEAFLAAELALRGATAPGR